MASKSNSQSFMRNKPRNRNRQKFSTSTGNQRFHYQQPSCSSKHAFIPEKEIKSMLNLDPAIDGGSATSDRNSRDKNNNCNVIQANLYECGKTTVDIMEVYMNQKEAFDKLQGSRLVEDVLLKGKYWRDLLTEAEKTKDYIYVYGIKVVLKNPSYIDMSKKRFFAALHLHNAMHGFGVRSALAVHIDIRNIKHKRAAELSRAILQLVGDGYNFFALQFKLKQNTKFGRRLFNEPGAFGIYLGFAFVLDYVAYRNSRKKLKKPIEFELKQYVEVFGDEGLIIKGIEKSSGRVNFEYEIDFDADELNMAYMEYLFDGVKFL